MVGLALILLSSFLVCSCAVLNKGKGGEDLVKMSQDDFFSLADQHQAAQERRQRRERDRERTQTQPETKAEGSASDPPARRWTATFLPGLISWMPKNDVFNKETACRLDCVGRWLAPSPTPPPEVLCAYIAARREGEFDVKACGEVATYVLIFSECFHMFLCTREPLETQNSAWMQGSTMGVCLGARRDSMKRTKHMGSEKFFPSFIKYPVCTLEWNQHAKRLQL